MNLVKFGYIFAALLSTESVLALSQVLSMMLLSVYRILPILPECAFNTLSDTQKAESRNNIVVYPITWVIDEFAQYRHDYKDRQ